MSSLSPGNPDFRYEQDPTAIWGDVTDPGAHNPGQFRYLVHAINPFAKMNGLMSAAYDARDGLARDKAWGDQTISMYDRPERLAERVSLSMSLIDQDHYETWGDAGLIVEAPRHNVVLTSGQDVGANNGNLEFLMYQSDQHGVMSGDALLASSSPDSYNEVVAVANRDGSKVILAGFFFKVMSNGEPYDAHLAGRMQAHAARLGLPAVAIRGRNPYSKDGVEIRDGRTAVNLNGRRLALDGYNDEWLFRSMDERLATYFAAPQEIEAALTYAVGDGVMTQAQADAISAKYEAANAERQAPKVVFAEDGTVDEIVFYEGYGANECKVRLGKSGYGTRTNLERQAAEVSRSMLGTYFTTSNRDRYYTPLSPTEAARIIQRACQSLGQDEGDRVRQWFAASRHVLEREWQAHTQYEWVGLSNIILKTHLVDEGVESPTPAAKDKSTVRMRFDLDKAVAALKRRLNKDGK